MREHEKEVRANFPKGRKIPTYALLVKMPGVEAAARPVLYPHSAFNENLLLGKRKKPVAITEPLIVKLALKSKLMSMYFPNREELSFLLVLALPNASRMSLDCSSTFFARSISACPDTLVTAAMYL